MVEFSMGALVYIIHPCREIAVRGDGTVPADIIILIFKLNIIIINMQKT